MDISDIANVYDDYNTKQLTDGLKKVKTYFGTAAFEAFLKTILDKDKPSFDKNVHFYIKDSKVPNTIARNDIIKDLDNAMFTATYHNLKGSDSLPVIPKHIIKAVAKGPDFTGLQDFLKFDSTLEDDDILV